jgi:Xaa-Pro aminopeptidase
LMRRAGAGCLAFSTFRCATTASAPAAAFLPVAGLTAGARPPDRQEYAEHVARLQTRLLSEGMDALLVEPGATMRYLSGVSWSPSERLFLLVVPARGELRWIAPAFEEGRARERTGQNADLALWQEHEDPAQVLLRVVPGKGTVGVDPGYQSDITRTFAVGRASDQARRAFEAVLAAQRAAFAQLRPGVAAEQVDSAARAVIEAAGFGADYSSFTHRLGHGIGLEGHEDPYLVRGNRLALRAGMTLSNEPGIYLPGVLGVRIEDIAAITPDGHRVFGPQVESFESAV